MAAPQRVEPRLDRRRHGYACMRSRDTYLWVRTSVDLDDRLLTLAKQTAAKRGITLREVLEQALRVYLEPAKKVEGYKLDLRIVRGTSPSAPVHDWSALRHWLDEEGR